jgi:hypothetical protein
LTDPKENHATESLAACLQFSPALRAEFVRFLFGTKPLPFDSALCAQLEVSSQVNVGKFGILDLYLSIPNELHIAIEVKVSAAEDARQLCAYRDWLKTQNGQEKFLFSLVCFPNQKFQFNKCGVLNRRTWRELFLFWQKSALNANETEQNIIRLFNDYLETQQIVATWKSSDLAGFGIGLRAKKALTNVFAILSDRLPANIYETKVVSPESEWPRLEIGKKTWERIFGKGYNNKLYVWFSVPGIWQATEHSFCPEIILWQRHHGNDWSATRQKVKAWIKQLADRKYHHWVEGKGIDTDKFDLTKSPAPNEPPRRIAASLDSAVIGEAHLNQMGEGDLVETLYQTVINQSTLIDSLR